MQKSTPKKHVTSVRGEKRSIRFKAVVWQAKRHMMLGFGFCASFVVGSTGTISINDQNMKLWKSKLHCLTMALGTSTSLSQKKALQNIWWADVSF